MKKRDMYGVSSREWYYGATRRGGCLGCGGVPPVPLNSRNLGVADLIVVNKDKRL